MTEAEELRPVPRERAILESFFTQLGMFSFDRAKDYVEKEKDSSKSAGAVWAALLAALAHLAAAEKAYHNMTFLGQKMGKKNTAYNEYKLSDRLSKGFFKPRDSLIKYRAIIFINEASSTYMTPKIVLLQKI